VFAMSAEEKLLLDVALVALIIVLVWWGWRSNRPEDPGGQMTSRPPL
jgi:hypothetical protein